jgi:thiol-disulfide isomerase/thioredoxin
VSRRRFALLACALAVAAAAAGYAFQRHDREAAGDPLGLPKSRTPERRPDFTLADLSGARRSVAEWDGQVVLINFWATWCPPCREEIPGLIELQRRLGDAGLQIVGIALDRPDAVQRLAAELGINYPVLIGDLDVIAVAREYGNVIGALPYTVVVDRAGDIAFSRQGKLSLAEAEAAVSPAL